MSTHEPDVLVIGSGIAGLTFALGAADRARVALVTKKERADSNTNYAQGGIAAVMGTDDRFGLHVRDTLLAGAGLSHGPAVRDIVREGPDRVRELMAWGADFSRTGDRLALGREGGHSRRRIVHAADFTGREIERTLLRAVADDPAIRIYDDHLAMEFLLGADARTGERRCTGALVLDRRTGERMEFHARATLLATGGLGRVYRHTTNPDIATGDGLAMAYRAGARVANLEFVQFHPTALYPAEDRAVLISEAVRGEGAVLRRRSGEPLLQEHPMGSLATRDVVARAIDAVLKETGDAYVLLDLSPIPTDAIADRFPSIFRACRDRGLDIRREPIPVVPASHYACGGVCADDDGRTSLTGLFAAGEVASTGVHGANRLASNSLLEALVYSHRAAAAVKRELARPGAAPTGCEPVEGVGAGAGTVGTAPAAAFDGAVAADASELAALEEELRDLMWRNAGIVRSDARLDHAACELDRLRAEVEARYRRSPPGAELIELRNLVQSATLIVRCARRRRESRGLHYNEDHPARDNERWLRDSVLTDAGWSAS